VVLTRCTTLAPQDQAVRVGAQRRRRAGRRSCETPRPSGGGNAILILSEYASLSPHTIGEAFACAN